MTAECCAALDKAYDKSVAGTRNSVRESVKDSVIIMQGDHRDTLNTELRNRGYKSKIAGG